MEITKSHSEISNISLGFEEYFLENFFFLFQILVEIYAFNYSAKIIISF